MARAANARPSSPSSSASSTASTTSRRRSGCAFMCSSMSQRRARAHDRNCYDDRSASLTDGSPFQYELLTGCARRWLGRGLRARWWAERLHGDALVTDVEYLEVLG